MTSTMASSKEGNINKKLTKCQKTMKCIHKQDCGFEKCVRCVAEDLDIRQSQDYVDICALCCN